MMDTMLLDPSAPSSSVTDVVNLPSPTARPDQSLSDFIQLCVSHSKACLAPQLHCLGMGARSTVLDCKRLGQSIIYAVKLRVSEAGTAPPSTVMDVTRRIFFTTDEDAKVKPEEAHYFVQIYDGFEDVYEGQAYNVYIMERSPRAKAFGIPILGKSAGGLDWPCWSAETASKHCSDADLRQVKASLSRTACRAVLRQLLDALTWLHDLGLSHNKLSMENVLWWADGFAKGTVFPWIKIGATDNIGLLGEHVDLSTDEFAHLFVPPEVFESGDSVRTAEWDVFSVGTLYYILLGECIPFDNDSTEEPSIADGFPGRFDMDRPRLRPFNANTVTATLSGLEHSHDWYLLLDMVHQDPAQRLSAAELLEKYANLLDTATIDE